jgi:hypothetical protein
MRCQATATPFSNSVRAESRIFQMKAIDRVMRAYSKTRHLTDEQATIVRRELSTFIHELTFGPNERPDQDDKTPAR